MHVRGRRRMTRDLLCKDISGKKRVSRIKRAEGEALFLLTRNRVNNGYFSIVFYSKVARKACAGCPDGAGVAHD